MKMFKDIIETVKSYTNNNLTSPERLKILDEVSETGNDCYYEEVLMPTVYETVESRTGLFLETSVQLGRGAVDAYINGGNEGCEHKGCYNFEDETNLMWDIISKLDVNDNGAQDKCVDAAVQGILNLLGIE